MPPGFETSIALCNSDSPCEDAVMRQSVTRSSEEVKKGLALTKTQSLIKTLTLIYCEQQ